MVFWKPGTGVKEYQRGNGKREVFQFEMGGLSYNPILAGELNLWTCINSEDPNSKQNKAKRKTANGYFFNILNIVCLNFISKINKS